MRCLEGPRCGEPAEPAMREGVPVVVRLPLPVPQDRGRPSSRAIVRTNAVAVC